MWIQAFTILTIVTVCKLIYRKCHIYDIFYFVIIILFKAFNLPKTEQNKCLPKKFTVWIIDYFYKWNTNPIIKPILYTKLHR